FDAMVLPQGRVTPLALVAPSPGAVLAYVAADPHAIGYLSMAHVTPAVKVIAVEGLLPTPETAADGSYALTRAWWIVMDGARTAAAGRFVDFVLGPAGQAIVGRSHGRVR
ncbi:MAG: phosphate-binding protein, partial [Anaerolineae bacterium]